MDDPILPGREPPFYNARYRQDVVILLEDETHS